MKLFILIIIIVCFIIFHSPFHYPYFKYKFDVTRKRRDSYLIERVVEKWLKEDGGVSMIRRHEEKIEKWKQNSYDKAKNSKFWKLRSWQLERAIDDSHAYKFTLVRYRKSGNGVDGVYAVSYLWFKKKFPEYFDKSSSSVKTISAPNSSLGLSNKYSGRSAQPVQSVTSLSGRSSAYEPRVKQNVAPSPPLDMRYESYRSKMQPIYRNMPVNDYASVPLDDARKISQVTKRAVLERDHYTCQICGISKAYVENLCPGLSAHLSLEIDHILSVKNGGSGDISNLQTLCRRCNNKKGGNKTNEQVAQELGIPYYKMTGRTAIKRPPYETTILRADLVTLKGCTLETAARFAADRIQMNPEVINLLINKVINSGVSPEFRADLFVKILVNLLDNNKI